MASAEALEHLNCSAATWNAFVAKTDGTIDLTMAEMPADLTYRTFDRCDLTGATFDTANLDDATFRSCIIRNATAPNCSMVRTTLIDCDFRDSDLRSLVARRATIERCDFSDCDLSDGEVVESTAASVTLAGARLNVDGLAFRRAKISGATFKGIRATTLTFDEGQVDESTFADCVVKGLSLSRAHWSKVRILACKLEGSLHCMSIRDSRIEELKLEGKTTHLDLSGTEIVRTDLVGIGLATAILFGTTLIDCVWPVQKGSTSWSGVHTTSANLLGHPVQDLRGISPLLRREIADAQFIREKSLAASTSRARAMLRLWAATCDFGQSITRLVVCATIAVALHTAAYLASRGELFGWHPSLQLATNGFGQIASAFLALPISPTETDNPLGWAVITSSRIVGFVTLGLLISVASSNLAKLSAE